jgi:hypothetical protein
MRQTVERLIGLKELIALIKGRKMKRVRDEK